MRRYVVLRQSPNWLTFDFESSRAFCRSVALPENLIIDFAAMWGRHFRLTYKEVRHGLKSIALATHARTGGELISIGDVAKLTLQDEDWLAFTDDDDWYAPELFDHLAGDDGAVFGCWRLGIVRPGMRADKVLFARPIQTGAIFTNAYAVTGRTLKRVGIEAIAEHTAATRSCSAGAFSPRVIERYLSCAIKHPCSAAAISRTTSFTADPVGELARFTAELDVPAPLPWLEQPLHELHDLMRSALPNGR